MQPLPFSELSNTELDLNSPWNTVTVPSPGPSDVHAGPICLFCVYSLRLTRLPPGSYVEGGIQCPKEGRGVRIWTEEERRMCRGQDSRGTSRKSETKCCLVPKKWLFTLTQGNLQLQTILCEFPAGHIWGHRCLSKMSAWIPRMESSGDWEALKSPAVSCRKGQSWSTSKRWTAMMKTWR